MFSVETKQRIYAAYRRNPLASLSEVAKEADVPFYAIVAALASDRDFKTVIKSYQGIKKGITSP